MSAMQWAESMAATLGPRVAAWKVERSANVMAEKWAELLARQ